jgi:3-methyladenine DNA glycosylase/8-oxoguanine DNA glycosylase
MCGSGTPATASMTAGSSMAFVYPRSGAHALDERSTMQDAVPTATLATGDVDLASTLATVAFLPDDPTVRLGPGSFARATTTPDGPASVRVTWSGGEAAVETHGPGGAWLLERAPGLLGLEDDVTTFRPQDPGLAELWRRHRGDRIARTRTLWHDLAWFVVQQRVDRTSAAQQWARLVRTHGEAAPGDLGLLVPPDPRTIARLDYAALHLLGIERRRDDALRLAARAAGRLAGLVDGPFAAAAPALDAVRGIGPWTRACLVGHTWGDADTVVVGDAGIPAMVGWLLARERGADDRRMLELLEPHRPHRYRIVRLAFHAGATPPRRAPRGHRTDIRRL